MSPLLRPTHNAPLTKQRVRTLISNWFEQTFMGLFCLNERTERFRCQDIFLLSADVRRIWTFSNLLPAGTSSGATSFPVSHDFCSDVRFITSIHSKFEMTSFSGFHSEQLNTQSICRDSKSNSTTIASLRLRHHTWSPFSHIDPILWRTDSIENTSTLWLLLRTSPFTSTITISGPHPSQSSWPSFSDTPQMTADEPAWSESDR